MRLVKTGVEAEFQMVSAGKPPHSKGALGPRTIAEMERFVQSGVLPSSWQGATPNLLIMGDLSRKGLLREHTWFHVEFDGYQGEMVTRPHDSRNALIDEFENNWASFSGVCKDRGWSIIGGSLYPGRYGRYHGDMLEITPLSLYRDNIMSHYGITANEAITNSIHINMEVGPSVERLLFVHNVLRIFIPHFAALSVSGPILRGRMSGLADARHVVWGNFQRDMSGVPPYFLRMADYERHMQKLRGYGQMTDRLKTWYDIVLRPSVGQGVVEVRMCSMPINRPMIYHLAGALRILASKLCDLYDQHISLVHLPQGKVFHIQQDVDRMDLSLFKSAASQKGLDAQGYDFFLGEDTTLAQSTSILLEWLLPDSGEHEPDILALLDIATKKQPTQAERILQSYKENGEDAHKLVTKFLVPEMEE